MQDTSARANKPGLSNWWKGIPVSTIRAISVSQGCLDMNVGAHSQSRASVRTREQSEGGCEAGNTGAAPAVRAAPLQRGAGCAGFDLCMHIAHKGQPPRKTPDQSWHLPSRPRSNDDRAVETNMPRAEWISTTLELKSEPGSEWPLVRGFLGGRGGTKHERARRYHRTALGGRGAPCGGESAALQRPWAARTRSIHPAKCLRNHGLRNS